MVCEYCHNFGRSVHRMREAFLPVTRVLMSFMKDPAKAKEVKDRITQLVPPRCRETSHHAESNFANEANC